LSAEFAYKQTDTAPESCGGGDEAYLTPHFQSDTQAGCLFLKPFKDLRMRRWANFSLILPLLILLAAFLLTPMAVLWVRSVNIDGQITLNIYVESLTNLRYLTAFANTALLAVASTALALLVCTPTALYIERGRRKSWLAVALTIPLSLPGIVIGFFVILVFGRTGVVPQLFESLTGQRQLSFAYTFWGLLLGYFYFQIPRVVLVLRGAAAGISNDVLDAARTLGASSWRLYTHVILPTLRPALLNAASLSLATAFGAFGTAATLSRGFRVVPLEIAAAFTENFEPERASALSLLLAFVTTLSLVGVGRLTGQHTPQDS
jgi:putative spermidine/putrescine transport system permease protein